ncbi:Eco57I restriction-modification methylase domain-containing protein [Mucilaginibacter sp. RB4R14]|uniref:Eco57I restriction-modification methylase domain-containing protein n=1 Tax=Mucilaginibacter aurantiaciroseus TaxID=2949308 RepID=UPI00209067CB|nr:TaqI-like C-terminal specificity domain-containing protein [Mucilaginibacter aurantiaciroseus]MCO5936888.1 Eco57I restriction-modification methylase domain-containing protein [Mucilaginibacter aurantiaciroseus]
MDKKIAQSLIERTFNESFNEEQFILFVKNLLNDLEPKNNIYSGNLLWDDYKEHINSYKRIGKYIDPEGEALDVLIVEVKSISKLEKARTVLRNFVIKHLSKFEKDYALVAFYSKEDNGDDWRFSFIKLEYHSEFDEEKGKVKTKKEFTPAKRYSFLVGKYEKAHTAKNQLLPLLQNIVNNPSIRDLESAFSIEKVTDEFFNQYKDLYIKLSEHFENDQNVKAELKKSNIDNARFTKKLLGQIVFLYFLQKKGWLGVAQNAKWGSGKKRFVQELFNQSEIENVNFFKDKLQYLFYEALAKERDNENSYYAKLDCRIPFLNGGLFEADYHWQTANISIPTLLFRNEEKNKAGDIGTGALDVFDRYNFTIKEDEPLDKEVAVDPEMLGKVFENMLEVTERKSKGAFYTPREIVHYMCQESLINYLDNVLNNKAESFQALDTDQIALFGGAKNKNGQGKLEIEHDSNPLVSKKDLELFIREGHFALENDQRVVNKGETKTYQYQLPESVRQHAALIDKTLSEIRICDPAIGSGAFPVGLLHELVNAQMVLKPHFDLNYLKRKLDKFGFRERESINESRYIYRLKRHIIQESIYGVDIDESAIDIARLRLWLSLVVDEDDLDPIETLPNLDYKIVCGSSLIGMAENAMRDLHVEAELESLKESFYGQTNEEKKKALRQQINSKIRELLNSAEQFGGYKIDFDFKLFFSEVWREKGGFDVVIGNPPYKIEYDKNLKNIYEELYLTFKRNNDIYVAFFHKGLNLLGQNGSLNYITPNTFLNGDYFNGLRSHISKNFGIIEIIDFKSHPVFSDPTVFVSISHISKSKNNQIQKFKIFSGEFPIIEFKEIHSNVDTQASFIPKHPAYNKISNAIKVKFDDLFLIKDVGFNYWSQGAEKTRSLNSIGKRVFLKKKENKNDIPYLKGTQLHPFYIEEASNFLRYNYQDYLDPDIDTFRFSKDILDVNPKICYRQTANKIIAAVDRQSQFCDKTVHVIVNKKGNSYDLNIVATLLNSELFLFLYREISQEGEGRAFSQVKTTYIKKLPFKYLDDNNISVISFYLETGYSIISESISLNFFKTLLDGIVYELYFPKEIKSAGKEILKHLGNLKAITNDMSEEEKLTVIESEFMRLYDPNHPIRVAIETLDSVEDIRIIKEALKR